VDLDSRGLALVANLLLAPEQPMWAILFGLFLVGAILLSPERNLRLLFAKAPRASWVTMAIYVVLVAATTPGTLVERARIVGIVIAQALLVVALAYKIFLRRVAKDDRDKR
jgi:hypothetical protein